MLWFGREFKGHLIPISLSWTGTPFTRLSLDLNTVRVWVCTNLPGKQVSHHTQSKQFLPNFQSTFLLFQFAPITPCPTTTDKSTQNNQWKICHTCFGTVRRWDLPVHSSSLSNNLRVQLFHCGTMGRYSMGRTGMSKESSETHWHRKWV